MEFKYGWYPDSPDERDHLFACGLGAHAAEIELPSVVDLRNECPTVYNQSTLGSCTANAIAAAIEFDQIKQKLTSFMPSRLFIYYNERLIEGTVGSDCGALIRDGIKSVNNSGVCEEAIWPYRIDQFAVTPPQSCYTEANSHKVLQYQRINQNLVEMKTCLASGYPFVFGFICFQGFESPQVSGTGILNLPTQEEAMVGGHAIMCVGYNDNDKRFIIRNSWGEQWGQKGYFTIPYEYVLNENLANDFWTIRVVE